jgi:hypothetical protein
MGCCSCQGEDASEVFKPRRKRWCTDIICLALFLAFCGYAGFFFVLTYQKDPSLLDDILYPKDSYGNNCGKPGSNMAAYPKAIFPTLDADIIAQLPLLAAGIFWQFKPTVYCAQDCPDGFSLKDPTAYGGSGYPGLVQPPLRYYSYVTQNVLARCFPKDTTSVHKRIELCVQPACSNSTLNATLSGSVFCHVVDAQPDADNVWRICAPGTAESLCDAQRDACSLRIDAADTQTFVPHEQTAESETFTKMYASYVKLAVAAVESIITGPGFYTFLVAGLALPLGLAFVWALFLRFFAASLVYLMVVLYVVVCIAACFYLSIKAGWLDSSEAVATALDTLTDAAASTGNAVFSNVTDSLLTSAEGSEAIFYSVLAVIAMIFTLLSIVGILAARKAIKRLIAMIREMTKIFKDMFLIQLFPIGSFTMQLAIFGAYLIAIYFMAYVWLDQTWYIYVGILLTYVYGFLWSIQVVRATTWTSMAAAIAWWYCNINSANGSMSKKWVRTGVPLLFSSLWTVMLKHLGSICFGAGIIAFVQLLQVIMHALNSLTKNQQDKNKLLKLVMKCALCCLWCLEKTVKFISYYAYVYVAVRGDSFCYAAKETFVLMLENPGQVAINKMVQKLLGLLIGLATPIGCCLGAFYYLSAQTEYAEQYNPIYCAMAVFILSYLVTDSLVICFNCGIDTIFVCAFKDMKENKPPKFMSDSLRRGFGLPKTLKGSGDSNGDFERVSQGEYDDSSQPQKSGKPRKSKKVAPDRDSRNSGALVKP